MMIVKLLVLALATTFAAPASTSTTVKRVPGLKNNDIVRWTGTVNTVRKPSFFYIRALYRGKFTTMLRLQIQGFKKRLVVGSYECNVGPNFVAADKDFDLMVVTKHDKFLIYLNGYLKFVQPHSVGRPNISDVTVVAAYNTPKTKTLEVLTNKNFSDALSMDGCGQNTLGLPPPSFCDYRGPIHDALQRIVGGIDASPASQPWQVAIRLKPEYSEDGEVHKCGGTLISNCWVVTAGHCFWSISRSTVKRHIVRIGDYFNRDGTPYSSFRDVENSVDVNISYIIRHDRFTYDDVPENDIALIRLERCVQFDMFKSPACLPFSRNQLGPGDYCGISGWGALNHTQFAAEYPACLQSAEVEIKTDKQCSRMLGRTYLSKKMICANTPTTDSCQGDSGGPMICNFPEPNGARRFYLWGITSWGEGCGNSKKPGAYTRVTTYLGWLFMNTNLRPPVNGEMTSDARLRPQTNLAHGCVNYGHNV